MGQKLDTEKIAKGFRARRVGTVRFSGGYFGAMQLAAEVAAPGTLDGDGRPWTERRLIPLSRSGPGVKPS